MRVSFFRMCVLLLVMGATFLPHSGMCAPETKKDEANALMEIDFKKAPTNITSNSLSLKSDKRVFVYTGNVTVTQADMTLTCDALEGTYDENNQIERLTALKNVLIVKGDKIRAKGNRAVYTAKDSTMVLTDNPSVEQNGSTLTADLIRIYMQENRSVAEGQVKVTLMNGTPAAPGAAPVAPIQEPTPTPLGVMQFGDEAPR